MYHKKKWVVSGMWQSRLVTSWVGLLSPDSSACSDCVSFWPHPLLAMSNKQLPANRRGKQTVTARVSFLTASEPSGKRDTCNNPHRVSATFTKRALPTRETTSEPPKVARTCGVLHLLTSKCASRHNGMRFFDISTSKSGPTLVCFVHFDFEMCFAPQWRALFRHLNFQKWSDIGVLCILTSKCASCHNGVHFFDISTSKSGPDLVCFAHFDFEMCFAPQRRALFHVSSGQMAPHPPL